MSINWDFMKHLDDKQCIHPAAGTTISTARSCLPQMDKDIHAFLPIALGGLVKVSLIALTRSLKSLHFQNQSFIIILASARKGMLPVCSLNLNSCARASQFPLLDRQWEPARLQSSHIMKRTLISPRGLTNTHPFLFKEQGQRSISSISTQYNKEKYSFKNSLNFAPSKRGRKKSKGRREDCSTADNHATSCLQGHSNKLTEINAGYNYLR